MLIKFTIENYLSFRESVTLNLEAGNIKELQENLYKPLNFKGEITFLKSSAFYGANSSGKSNLLKAFALVRNLVLYSSKESHAHENINVEPFRLSEEYEHKSSAFELTILIEGNQLRYGFKVTAKRIVEEWLFITNRKKEENVFFRLGQTFELNKALKVGELKGKVQMLTEITRENALFISILSQFNIELGKKISDWFIKTRIVFDANNEEIIYHTASLLANIDYSSKINEIIGKSDLGFTSVDAKVKDVARKYNLSEQFIAAIMGDDLKSYTILTKHKRYKDGKHIENIYFDLMLNESLGSQKFFGLLGPVIQTLMEGGILFIDELDSRIHPLLLSIILKLFNSGLNNPNGAQLIFTLHSTEPLKSALRRDQMFFVEKDEMGGSFFSSLYEKNPKVRNDASFEKEYLSGKYGGIPKITSQLNLFEEDNTSE